MDDQVNAGPINLANQSFTLAAWAKRDRADVFEWIISQGQGLENNGLHFGFQANNVFQFGFWSNDLMAPAYTDTDWHYWVGTYDANTKKRAIYRDGERVANGEASANYQGSGDLIIGLIQPLERGYFQGRLDEVSVWNRALAESEIQANMHQVLTGNEDSLLGYWPFDEGAGTATADESPNSNQGTIAGATWVSATKAAAWNPTHVFAKAGEYTAHLRVQSEFGKWSSFQKTAVEVLDGRIAGQVRAADLRTPVKKVRLTLTSSHVDRAVLAALAASDPRLNTTSDGAILIETDEKGKYSFDHLPLGSYRIVASKVDGALAHEFEANIQITELTLDAPNQLAIDYVDLSVFPISGQVVYSIHKNGKNVLVEDVVIEAQAVGSTNTIKALPSDKAPKAGISGNYSMPLFSGKYLFLAHRQGHDIRIKESTPGYDSQNGLFTIEGARGDVDFVDRTTRQCSIFVEDSGGFAISTYPESGDAIKVTLSGLNGQVSDREVNAQGQLVVALNPGTYTVTVPGAEPESKEVNLTASDGAVTMIIPVPIVLELIGPRPRLINLPDEFQNQAFDDTTLGSQLAQYSQTEGFMFFYPPEPQTHTYTIRATANGQPVSGFDLTLTDDISQTTADPAQAQAPIFIDSSAVQVTIAAGLPRLDRRADPPLAAPKWIKFEASKEGYKDSEALRDSVVVLGDVAVGTAARIVSIPNVNYLALHDPPGDGSYAYLDDSMTMKGIVSGMTLKIEDTEVPVFPSPWTAERGVANEPDLGKRGLLGYRNSAGAGERFAIEVISEVAIGLGVLATGAGAYPFQLIKMGVYGGVMASDLYVQYEVSPNRHLETPSGDALPDLMGPGKGDIYYGEGWTLGLQTKYRLGIEWNETNNTWDLATAEIQTYDLLDRTNQYVYTIRDIEDVIANLGPAIATARTEGQADTTRLKESKVTWENLLAKNLAYQWNRYYVATKDKVADVKSAIADLDILASNGSLSKKQRAELSSLNRYLSKLNVVEQQISTKGGDAFAAFRENEGANLDGSKTETLIFSAGSTFEYSRTIAERDVVSFSREMGIETSGETGVNLQAETGGNVFGNGLTFQVHLGATASANAGVSLSKESESGRETQQTVGFVLHDDDVGDNISTRVYEDPVWGTPLFFTDAGSVTSDPWQPGTNKAVDVEMTLAQEPASDKRFDYRDGAHYTINLTYAGQRHLESAGINFQLYAPPVANPENLTVRFNGDGGPYVAELDRTAISVPITVSVYPPESDWGNSEQQSYPVVIQVEEEGDYQVSRVLTLTPKFADLRAPQATVVAPYAGQRISPVFFAVKPFQIDVVSADTDLDTIKVQIRSKQPDGVWEPWRNLDGVLWQEGADNANVTVLDYLEREPIRREFKFQWPDSAIRSLGVGEYALRAVATDQAGNSDLDASSVMFLVDASKPTVLNTVPDYQARDRERLYRGELSATFTDDMRPTDFTDRTFVVTDLQDNNNKVAGFVSYSSALRKAVFVPQVPFKSNGFYRVEVKTDAEQPDGTTEAGVHDLAGNPLDNALVWTFRTTESPFEPTWSIVLNATTGTGRDANNIAGVEYGALDKEDEKDVRAVPSLASQLRLNFVDREQAEFDRDFRPADGRLSHHWFFAVSNAVAGNRVTLSWQPSLRLTRTTRHYQSIRLVEFDGNGAVTNTIALDPTEASLNPNTGEIDPVEIYTYTSRGEATRFFRLDVQKAALVATNLAKGSSGWAFLSVPITPQRDDPFVNLGDDIDPFKLYQYDTQLAGYRISPSLDPSDLGRVSLQPGRGYFTRLAQDVEVDVGGASNQTAQTLNLAAVGWHAIGNPFVQAIDVAALRVNGQTFSTAVGRNQVEGILYRWKADAAGADAYEAVTSQGQLLPWEGYWLRTRSPNLTLTLPVPTNLANFIPPLPGSYQPPIQAAKPVADAFAQPAADEGEFDLRLELHSWLENRAFSSDVTTTLGTRRSAQLGWDGLDQSEPPTLGQTVAAYFDHRARGEASGMYNTDYQPALQPGQQRTWQFTVFSDKPDAAMTLSWEQAIEQLPDDIMLYVRPLDPPSAADDQDPSFIVWQDMRKVRSVDLETGAFITKRQFEVRAERQILTSLSGVDVVAGEQQVEISWAHSDNPFIERYIIERRKQGEEESTRFELPPTQAFVDTQVEEEATYTYQVAVRFQSGAQAQSQPFTVTVQPVIDKTVLLQSYPNPANPAVWIPYELAQEAHVRVKIYNMSGQLVRTLDHGVRSKGRYVGAERALYWDGRSKSGGSVASGIYFYVMEAGDVVAKRKLVLLW